MVLETRAAETYLRKLGAVLKQRTAEAHVYYSGAAKKWIKAVRTGDGQIRLTSHDSCPCGAA